MSHYTNEYKEKYGFKDSMGWLADCPDCDEGICWTFQHEGNTPYSGFSYPEICYCVVDFQMDTPEWVEGEKCVNDADIQDVTMIGENGI